MGLLRPGLISMFAVLGLLIPAATAGAAPPDPTAEVAPGVYLASAADASNASDADLEAVAAVATAIGTHGSGGSSAAAARSVPSPNIIGGSTTTIAEWPWQASITADSEFFLGNALSRHMCGGSLVAPNVLVSADHCFFDVLGGGAGFDDPDLFAAITGRTQLSSTQGAEVEVADVVFFVNGASQPLYDPATNEWDVVYVVLAANSSSETIKIAGPDENAVWAAGRDAFTTGWGLTSGGGAVSDILREAALEMVSDSTCQSPSVWGSTFFPAVMVCAGAPTGDSGPCNGDSGGPLVAPLKGGGFRLVGDTSFGDENCTNAVPTVWGRVADDPIRTALANGILSLTGVNVLGSGGKPLDFDAPKVKLSGRKSQRAGGAVKLKVRCDEACSVVASGKVVARGVGASGSDSAGAAKNATYKLKKAKASLEAGEKKTLKLKLKRRSDRRKLKRAVRGGAKAKAKLKLTATDDADNKSKAKRTVKLKKP